MKDYFAYIRVSTKRQGRGVSLDEQRDAILRYSGKNGIRITAWFEEKLTAAKRGRSVFGRMMKRLKRGEAGGIVIHKIDRSARNLRDWADLGDLMDKGVDVRFAHESLDLSSRGGRLSADIQAIVAADYIRNLREEVRKGFYGRLKQGIYPLPAPTGYLDAGEGKPKEPDPVKGPLVRRAFELYSTGQYSIKRLSRKMHRLGLTNRNGGRLSKNGWSYLLNNPFYVGIIRIRKSGRVFEGAHAPLLGKTLFDRVQAVLTGKRVKRSTSHDYLLRMRLRCRPCGYSLVGEKQKGRVYYRCHQTDCPTTSMREDDAEFSILRALAPLTLSREETKYARMKLAELDCDWEEERQNQLNALKLNRKQVEERLNRLTDAYLDGVVDRGIFEQRKKALLSEKKDLEERTNETSAEHSSLPKQVAEFLELAEIAQTAYKLGMPEEKRDLLDKLTSNRTLEGKNLVVELNRPFHLIANRAELTNGGSRRDVPRTIDALISHLAGFVRSESSGLSTP